MSEKYKQRKIGVSALCRLSAKGGAGIYLYIPRHYAEAYGLIGASFVEVHFRRVFIKVFRENDEDKIKDFRRKDGTKPNE